MLPWPLCGLCSENHYFLFAQVKKVPEQQLISFCRTMGCSKQTFNKDLYFVSMGPCAELRDIGTVHQKKVPALWESQLDGIKMRNPIKIQSENFSGGECLGRFSLYSV